MRQTIPQRQHRGDWAELRFMARAIAHGFTVSKPWGNARYDFLVEHEDRISRVQVKATSSAVNGLYHANLARRRPYLSPGSVPYSAQEIDFFAFYIIPADAWYIVPIAVVAKLRTGIRLNPRKPRNKYFTYLEAWHLLRAGAAAIVQQTRRDGTPPSRLAVGR